MYTLSYKYEAPIEPGQFDIHTCDVFYVYMRNRTPLPLLVKCACTSMLPSPQKCGADPWQMIRHGARVLVRENRP